MNRAIAILLLLLTTVTASWAEETINDSLFLEQVVVTGTRTPKLLMNSPIQTRVITLQDIERTDATDIQDLLTQDMPGVEFTYAFNQQTHMNFFGFGGQSVLFLIDGERMAGETMDDIDFTRVNMGNIERIEIIKGAASALYGSNATGGVINVITKTQTQPWTLNVNGRIGNHHNNRYGLSFGLNGKRISNMLHFNGTNIDTYEVSNGDKNLAQTKYMVDRYYGDKTYNINDKLTWRPIDNLKMTFKAGYFFREKATTSENEPDHYRDITFGMRGLWDITSRDVLELTYNFDQYDKARHFINTDVCLKNYSNVQNSVRGVFNHAFSNGDIITIGGDFMRDYLHNPKMLNSSNSQCSTDIFAQYDWNISDRWEMVGALRYDHFSEGNINRLSPKLNIRYLANRNLTLRAGYGMGFRAPSLKEKYYIFNMAGIWDIVGSSIYGKELKPEVSHNFNMSAEWVIKGAVHTLSAYYNHISNRITTGVPAPKEVFPGDHDMLGTRLWLPYTNIEKHRIYGMDFTVNKQWANGIGIKASYAYVHEVLPKDENNDDINNQYQPARPHAVNASINWDKDVTPKYAVSMCLSGRFLSSVNNLEYIDYMTTDPSTGKLARNNVHYNPYTIWKFQLTQRFHKAFKLTFTIDNLLNYNPTYHYFNAPFTDGTSVQCALSIDINKL